MPYDTASLPRPTENGGPYVFSWVDDNGNTISSTSSGNSSAITPTPVSSFTNYTVTVEDNCETPMKTDSLQIDWHELPTVLFDADVVDGCYPVTVQFTNNTLPLNIQSSIWNIGNGVTSNNNDSYPQFIINRAIHVSLQVTSPESCVNDTTFYNLLKHMIILLQDFFRA